MKLRNWYITACAGGIISVLAWEACTEQSAHELKKPLANQTESASNTEYPMKLDGQARNRLADLENEGFLTLDDTKWTDEERKAVNLTWERYTTAPWNRTKRVLPRFKVEHTSTLMIVRMGFVAFDAKGNPLASGGGGGFFTMSISNDFRDVKILPGG